MKSQFGLLLLALLAFSFLPRAEGGEDFTAEIFDLYSSSPTKETMTLEELETIFADLGIPHTEEEGGHDDHAHRLATRSEDEHEHEQDFSPHSPEELLALYNITHPSPYTHEDFNTISPAILHELLAKYRASLIEEPTPPPPSRAKAWGFAILATIIICLLSLLGLPLSRWVGNQLFLNGLIGLGVGVLVGDAIFHLIPTAYGVHGHGHAEEGPQDERRSLYISLVLCAGVFALYVAEHMFHMFMGTSAHSHGHHHREQPPQPQDQGKPEMMSVEDDPEKGLEGSSSEVSKDGKDENHNHSHGKDKKTFLGVQFVGWAILINDSIHNFIDGLAIGSSFSSSLLLGWITSLAVLLHELPHEIADFFILINAGFTVKWALLSNLISSFTALLGCAVGVALGTLNSESSTAYVLALTAGFFIYISLATLLPEIDSGGHKLNFLVATTGIVLGFLSMILLAVFEEDLEGLAG